MALDKMVIFEFLNGLQVFAKHMEFSASEMRHFWPQNAGEVLNSKVGIGYWAKLYNSKEIEPFSL